MIQPAEILENQECRDLTSFSLVMVSELTGLLNDKGFGEHPVDIVEALAFAMFVVVDTFRVSRSEKEHAIEVIHSFFDDMQDYFINEIVVKANQAADLKDIRSASEKFRHLSWERFTEYGDRLKQDLQNAGTLSCPITVSYLLDNLFIEPLAEEERMQLMDAVSDQVIKFWSRCVQRFQGPYGIN